MSSLSQQAITAAINQNWDEAIRLNNEIIAQVEKDIPSLNRLAFALCQIGKINEAKKIYRKILLTDKYNSIAQKNLDKLDNFKKSKKNSVKQSQVFSPSLFIEEPGKTKTVALKHIAPTNILASLDIGIEVKLACKKFSVDVRDTNNTYIGTLPDDLAFRLIRFIKAGNTYSAYIKNVTKNIVSVFLKEVHRGKKFINQPSFINLTREEKHPHKDQKAQNDDEEENEEKRLSQDEEWVE